MISKMENDRVEHGQSEMTWNYRQSIANALYRGLVWGIWGQACRRQAVLLAARWPGSDLPILRNILLLCGCHKGTAIIIVRVRPTKSDPSPGTQTWQVVGGAGREECWVVTSWIWEICPGCSSALAVTASCVSVPGCQVKWFLELSTI